jgi:plasmid stabilization system protein ParE
MKPFILTPQAEQDISDIWDYIAADSIEAADRVLDAWKKPSTSWRRTLASATCAKNWLTAGIASFWFIPT